MGETGRARGEAEIGRLRRQVLALADADCLRPEDGLALLATLDPALLDLAAGDVPAAGECIDRFISRLQFLMSDGLLGEREGRPPLEAAHRLLASMASSGTASALGDKLPSS